MNGLGNGAIQTSAEITRNAPVLERTSMLGDRRRTRVARSKKKIVTHTTRSIEKLKNDNLR